jgi:hypothetical protein
MAAISDLTDEQLVRKVRESFAAASYLEEVARRLARLREVETTGLTSMQRGNALAAIDQLVRAVAFDDPVSYRVGAKQIASVERDHLISALDRATEERVERSIRTGSSQHASYGDVVDTILDALGKDRTER